MNRRFFTSLKLSLAASVMLALGAAQAHALDGKVYPGSMCVPWTNNYQFDLSGSAMLNHNSSIYLDVDCPVIHDSIGYPINSGSVLVRDQSGPKAISCTLNSLFNSGGGLTGWWSPTLSSAGSGANAQLLSFGGVTTISGAHDYFSCHIPPVDSGKLSSIISYKLTEGGPNE